MMNLFPGPQRLSVMSARRAHLRVHSSVRQALRSSSAWP